jgi:hypothetical protein
VPGSDVGEELVHHTTSLHADLLVLGTTSPPLFFLTKMFRSCTSEYCKTWCGCRVVVVDEEAKNEVV